MFSSKAYAVLKQIKSEYPGVVQTYKDVLKDFDVCIVEVNGIKNFIFEEENKKEHFSLYFTSNESELITNTIIDYFPVDICLRKARLPYDSSIQTLFVQAITRTLQRLINITHL